jgi:hypothetical protein
MIKYCKKLSIVLIALFFAVSPSIVSADSVNSAGYIELSPVTAVAASNCSKTNLKTFKDIVSLIVNCYFNDLIYIMLGLAIIFFMFGVFKFMTAEGDDKKAGKDIIVWGIIGIFVLISMWGLVAILQNTFVLNTD